MVQVIFSKFTPKEKQQLARIVLNCVSKGECESEFYDLKKAFEIAKDRLKKPTPEMCQYVWQEHLRNYYRSLYEKALQKGSLNRNMRKKINSSEENRYFVSLVCTEIMKGSTISQALSFVSEIIKLKESTVKTKWYKLLKNEEYNRQYKEALENKIDPQTNELEQEDSGLQQGETSESIKDETLNDETFFLDSIDKFVTSYKNMKLENEQIKTQYQSLQEKYEGISSELENMRNILKSLL